MVLRYSAWLNDVYSRELLRVDPIRYLWKESDKLALLGIPTAVALKVIPQFHVMQTFYKQHRFVCLASCGFYALVNVVYGVYLRNMYQAGSVFNPSSKHKVAKH